MPTGRAVAVQAAKNRECATPPKGGTPARINLDPATTADAAATGCAGRAAAAGRPLRPRGRVAMARHWVPSQDRRGCEDRHARQIPLGRRKRHRDRLLGLQLAAVAGGIIARRPSAGRGKERTARAAAGECPTRPRNASPAGSRRRKNPTAPSGPARPRAGSISATLVWPGASKILPAWSRGSTTTSKPRSPAAESPIPPVSEGCSVICQTAPSSLSGAVAAANRTLPGRQ